MTDRPLTVAQASQHLGISERTLRRLLRDPKMAAKTQAEHRHTRTGQRRAVLLSPELLIEIAEFLGRTCSENIGKNAGRTQAEFSAYYERLLDEKDARIAQLVSALEHERAQSHRHADAHARAQDLLKPSEPSGQPPPARLSLLERFIRRQR